MSKLLIILLIVTGFTCDSPSSDSKKDNSSVSTSTKQEGFLIEDERFSIRFPKKPEKEIDSIDYEHDQLVHISYQSVGQLKNMKNLDSIQYLFSYTDYSPKQIPEPIKFLDNQCNQIIRSYEFTKEEIKDLKTDSWEGHPAISVKMGASDKIFLDYRIVLVNNRLYQLFVWQNTDFANQSDVQNFFNSFQIKEHRRKNSRS